MNAYLLNRKDIVIANTKEEAIKYYDRIPQCIHPYNVPVLKLSLIHNYMERFIFGKKEVLTLKEYVNIATVYSKPPVLIARVTNIPFDQFVTEQ